MASARHRSRGDAGPVVAALDVGSHKVTCLIGIAGQPHGETAVTHAKLRVLGIGHLRSEGIAAGTVVDLERAQAAVAAAVSQAERAAGVRVERVHLGIDCAGLRSRTFGGHVDLPRGTVDAGDIARLDAGARAFAGRDGSHLLALNRIGFRLDGAPATQAPLGLAGRRLDASFHAVTAEPGPIRNLCLLGEACHLAIAGLVPSAFASALAATTEAERQAGVVCADIGAGTTSLAAFADGHLVLCATLPIGAQLMTEDLARAAGMALAEAERIKTLYASVIPGVYDEHHLLQPNEPAGGMVGVEPVTRAEVGRVAARVVHRILAGVHCCLESCGIERIRRAAIVLTGGGSELLGLEALTASAMARPVRTSTPTRLEGAAGRVAAGASSPAFSCVVGLAMAAVGPSPWVPATRELQSVHQGYLGRVEQWLRESF